MATCGSFIIAEKKDLDNLLYKEYHVLNPTKYGNLQGRVKFPTGGEFVYQTDKSANLWVESV